MTLLSLEESYILYNIFFSFRIDFNFPGLVTLHRSFPWEISRISSWASLPLNYTFLLMHKLHKGHRKGCKSTSVAVRQARSFHIPFGNKGLVILTYQEGILRQSPLSNPKNAGLRSIWDSVTKSPTSCCVIMQVVSVWFASFSQ